MFESRFLYSSFLSELIKYLLIFAIVKSMPNTKTCRKYSFLKDVFKFLKSNLLNTALYTVQLISLCHFVANMAEMYK